jgi:hypothetical protein
MANGGRDFIAGFIGGFELVANIKNKKRDREERALDRAERKEDRRLDREDRINARLDDRVRDRAALKHSERALDETIRANKSREGTAAARDKRIAKYQQDVLKQNEPLVAARAAEATSKAQKNAGINPELNADLAAGGVIPADQVGTHRSGAIGAPTPPAGGEPQEYNPKGWGENPLVFEAMDPESNSYDD